MFWLLNRQSLKFLKILFGGKKYDMIVSDVLNITAWHYETDRIGSLLNDSSFGQGLMDISNYTIQTIMEPYFLTDLGSIIPRILVGNNSANDFLSEYDLFRRLLSSEDHPLSLFESNMPWPHIVIDDLINVALLHNVRKEIDNMFDDSLRSISNSMPTMWRSFVDTNQRKYGTADPSAMGPETVRLIAELKSFKFVSFLERLTGISGLIADPWDVGGGVHVVQPGGYLKAHTDFPFHRHLHLWRRVNVLLYLNENWDEEWGGHLSLYPLDSMGNSNNNSLTEKKISPLFNRMVIFRTDNTTLHGHPEPLACPSSTIRKSIALYYYSSNIEPGDHIIAKTTEFTVV